LKTDTIKEQHLVDGQKFIFKKTDKFKNEFKMTDGSNGSHTDDTL